MVWIYGAAGLGKSRLGLAYAKHRCGEDYYVHMAGPLKWWDGYEGQQCVVLDDFRRRQLKEAGGFSYLLRILDRYDVDVEVKGGSRRANWSLVIITGQRSPIDEFTYKDANNEERVEEDIAQLIRRLAHVIELRVVGGVVQEVEQIDLLRSRYPHLAVDPLGRSVVFGLNLLHPE